MANPQSPLERALSRLLKSDPPRAKSLCVSVLGDALAPHGGAIWLGSLIELLAPLGINERLLRTSVFRLVAQNWLQSERHGRRSLYLISEQGARYTSHASQRIYEGGAKEWNGEWTLVALPRTGNGLAERGELRRELTWEGFGMIAPGLFAHPHTEARAAHEILEKLGIPDRALVLSARDLAGAGGLPIASSRAISARWKSCWTTRPRPQTHLPSASWCCTAGAGSSCTTRSFPPPCCRTTGPATQPATYAAGSTGRYSIRPRSTWMPWPARTTNAIARCRPRSKPGLAGGRPDSPPCGRSAVCAVGGHDDAQRIDVARSGGLAPRAGKRQPAADGNER